MPHMTCGQQSAIQDRTKDTETPSPHIPWNNSPLEKNPTAKSKIESDASLTEGNEVTTKSNSRTNFSFVLKKYTLQILRYCKYNSYLNGFWYTKNDWINP